MGTISSIKRRTFEILFLSKEGDTASRAFDYFLSIIIIANVIAFILETVDSINEVMAPFFLTFELVSVTIFAAEYLALAWSCTTDPRFAHPIKGRLRYLTRPLAILDLLAILPSLAAFGKWDGRILRIFRIMRIFRVLKLGHYSRSMRLLVAVFQSKHRELVVTLSLAGLVITLAGSLVYFAEHEAQPEVFSSIPASLWWAVITMTTVGYGDAYPVTPIGQLLGGTLALLGIGLIALPAGIIASGLSEVLKNGSDRICPHCGAKLDE